mgnify:CR=1 FL=1
MIIIQALSTLKNMVAGYSSRKSNYTACMYVCKGKYKCVRIKNSLTVRVRFFRG